MIAAVIFTSSCTSQTDSTSSPPGYNFKNAEKFNLTDKLLEVSGIAINKGMADTIYAVQDEEGKLFKLGWGNKNQFNTTFSKRGDYEDLTIVHDKVFIIKSNGSLYSVPLNESGDKKAGNVKEYKKVLPSGEYESLYFDSLSNRLVVLCKSCKADKKSDKLSGYILTYSEGDSSLTLSGTISIDTKTIEAHSVNLRTEFKPSALAKHPATGQWYILSSANKLLVVTDNNWRVTDVYKLNSNVFLQPEGLAFDRESNLFISNEGDEIASGNILKFKYAP